MRAATSVAVDTVGVVEQREGQGLEANSAGRERVLNTSAAEQRSRRVKSRTRGAGGQMGGRSEVERVVRHSGSVSGHERGASSSAAAAAAAGAFLGPRSSSRVVID